MGHPSHWTYSPLDPSNDLRQGDIIGRTPGLLAILSKVLSHFCDENYTAFLVVTQSCDLVRRHEEPCKTEYLNLCVVRELEPLLPTILEPCCGTVVPGVFASDSRQHAEQLLKKVLNQNDQAHGLFYLHPDADVGIATASVAMLRVSIALRREHYGMLQKSRCGRLHSEYSNKLGWLTGNLYSRVATPDWEEKENDTTASSKQAELLLRSISQPQNENWVPQELLKAAQTAGEDLGAIPLNRFRSTLAKYARPELIDVVLESVSRVGQGVIAYKACDAISERLAKHDQFLHEVLQQIVSSAAALLSVADQALLLKALAAGVKFREAIASQIGNQLKRKVAEMGKDAVDGLPDLLAGSVGMLVPNNTRMRDMLSPQFGPDRSTEVGEIADLVARTCLFNPAAIRIAKEVGQEAFAQFDFAMLDKLTSQLKNDQKLTAACRGHSAN